MGQKNKRWVHLAAGVLAELCVGIVYAWSVFQNPLMEKFGWSTSAVSVAFTIATCMGATAPLIGKLQEYVKTKTIVLAGGFVYGACLVLTGTIHSIAGLYICFGLGVGLGTSMIYPLVISYMVKIFPEKRGLVSGLMVASYGSGAIVWAPIGAYLIRCFGVLSAFKILGIGLFILIAIISRFIGDVREKRGTRADGASIRQEDRRDKTWQEMLRMPIFWIMFSALSIGAMTGLMILAHASPMIQTTLGMTAQKASFIVGFLAAANALGRLCWGAISDRTGRYPLLIFLFVLSIAAFGALAGGSTMLFIPALVAAELCYGGYIALIAPLTADVFGVWHLSVNYGIMFIAFSIGGIVGPRVAAMAYEAAGGNYHVAYVTALSLCFIGLVLAVIAAIKSRALQYV
jgi:OFA family oxalate/formate antiporter-like MFS transporter